MADRVFKNDTAIIEAVIYDEDGVTPLPASSVSWTVKKPDGTTAPGGPQLLEEAETLVAFNDTALPGAYQAQVQFTLPSGDKRSVVLSFHVVDPLEVTGEATTDVDKTVDLAWMKLEDLWDSDLGGPHLRDATKAIFDREKIRRLLPDALYNINNVYQPATGFDETTFPYQNHRPLLAQALLVESIGHLMRAYVEQPLPAGANVSYFDRRDYLQRWQMILQMELDKLNRWLDLFKRDLMGLGYSAMLVGGYASYPSRVPRYMRGRYPYIVRY